MSIRIAVLIVAGLTAAATSSAHHGFGNFAMNEGRRVHRNHHASRLRQSSLVAALQRNERERRDRRAPLRAAVSDDPAPLRMDTRDVCARDAGHDSGLS